MHQIFCNFCPKCCKKALRAVTSGVPSYSGCISASHLSQPAESNRHFWHSLFNFKEGAQHRQLRLCPWQCLFPPGAVPTPQVSEQQGSKGDRQVQLGQKTVLVSLARASKETIRTPNLEFPCQGWRGCGIITP